MSALGVKAGEEIRTPDVQLGKRRVRPDNYSFTKWLRRLSRNSDQLGARRLATFVSQCHLLAVLIDVRTWDSHINSQLPAARYDWCRTDFFVMISSGFIFKW